MDVHHTIIHFLHLSQPAENIVPLIVLQQPLHYRKQHIKANGSRGLTFNLELGVYLLELGILTLQVLHSQRHFKSKAMVLK
jgi:hypothetical protein